MTMATRTWKYSERWSGVEAGTSLGIGSSIQLVPWRATGYRSSKRLPTPTRLVAGTPTVECETATAEVETLATSALVIPVETSFPTFENCSDESGACSVTSINGPLFEGPLVAMTEGDGNLGVLTGESGNPGVKVTCEGGTLICMFEGQFKFEIFGGNPAVMFAEDKPLQDQAPSDPECSETAKWNAKYKITSHTPLFVVAEP